MEALLGSVHGLDYIFNHFLIGSLVFSLMIVQAGGEAAIQINSSQAKFVSKLIIAGFLTSAGWLIFSLHDMAESWDLSDLTTAITQTSFSHIWCIKLLAFIALYFVAHYQDKIKFSRNILILSILLMPLPYVLTGHAAAQEDYTFIRMSLDWLHSITAGVWTGGLFGLYLWLDKKTKYQSAVSNEISYSVVKRFSHFAMASTGLIGLSGVVTAYLNQVSIFNISQSQYGILIIYKILFFSLALGAAAINQFLHLRKWTPQSEPKFSFALRREVGFELIFVLIIFMIAGFLTRTALPAL